MVRGPEERSSSEGPSPASLSPADSLAAGGCPRSELRRDELFDGSREFDGTEFVVGGVVDFERMGVSRSTEADESDLAAPL